MNPALNRARQAGACFLRRVGSLGVLVFLPLVSGGATAFTTTNNNLVSALAVQADGKILVGGKFTSWSGQTQPYLARLTAGGTLDSSFAPLANGPVACLALQPDGQIVVGGSFTKLGQYSLQNRTNLGRFSADGVLDFFFNPPIGSLGFVTSVSCLALQPDGRIVVGGSFSRLGGQAATGFGRLNADGTVDTGFTPGLNSYLAVGSLALQPDGKILVAGTSVAPTTITNVVRLNTDGTLDATFNAGPGANISGGVGAIDALVVQPDGKVLVGGSFQRLGGRSCTNLARLNANGSWDTTFRGWANSTVFALALQADGKILVAGAFTTLGGQSRASLGRLLTDGTVDASFSGGAYSSAYAVTLQPNGEVLLAGGGLASSGYVQRLSTADAAPQGLRCDGSTANWTRAGASPEVWRATFEFSTDGSTWAALGDGVRVPDGWWLTNIAPPANSTVRARGYLAGSGSGSGWFTETTARVLPCILQDSSLGLHSGSFGFTVSGGADWAVVVERSADLFHWDPVGTNTLTLGRWYFEEPIQPGTGFFYRVRLE
jgi:uncharacterized delta-60 repeat protein